MNPRIPAALVTLVFAGAATAAQKTVVPAFFALSQNTSGTTADWTRISNEGSAVLAVVPLGDSGGFETLTGTGLTSARSQFGTNHTAGQLVLGYVAAGFACTASGNLATKLSNVKTGTYGVSTWYSAYPSQLQGIFFDEGPQVVTTCPAGTDLVGNSPESEGTQKTYYSAAYSDVGSNHSGAKVMLNASQFEHDWIMTGTYQSADYAVIFEQDYNTWYGTYKAEDGTSPGWWTSGYSGQLANVIYNATQYDIDGAVTQSQTSTYGSPVFYLYDGSSHAYDHVSCGFERLVAKLQGTTPVPSATTYCSGSCTDLDSDPYNCGACGNSCPGGLYPVCSQATCWINCGNECWQPNQQDCSLNCP